MHGMNNTVSTIVDLTYIVSLPNPAWSIWLSWLDCHFQRGRFVFMSCLSNLTSPIWVLCLDCQILHRWLKFYLMIVENYMVDLKFITWFSFPTQRNWFLTHIGDLNLIRVTKFATSARFIRRLYESRIVIVLQIKIN